MSNLPPITAVPQHLLNLHYPPTTIPLGWNYNIKQGSTNQAGTKRWRYTHPDEMLALTSVKPLPVVGFVDIFQFAKDPQHTTQLQTITDHSNKDHLGNGRQYNILETKDSEGNVISRPYAGPADPKKSKPLSVEDSEKQAQTKQQVAKASTDASEHDRLLATMTDRKTSLLDKTLTLREAARMQKALEEPQGGRFATQQDTDSRASIQRLDSLITGINTHLNERANSLDNRFKERKPAQPSEFRSWFTEAKERHASLIDLAKRLPPRK